VPHRFVWLMGCVLLSASTFAEEKATPASVPHHPGRQANQNPRRSPAITDSAPLHSKNKNEARSPDLAIPEGLHAADLMAIQKPSEEGNAAAGGGPGSRRTTFFLQREHDAAIKLLTTSIVLRVKLSADGVNLQLAF